MGWYSFAPYVSVAKRKQQAAREIEKLRKKGKAIQPVVIEGRAITKTFWGKAWCQNLESYSDYVNRLPRGRSYVRHGSVIDLQIDNGEIKALVKGSSVYKVKISITPVTSAKWMQLIKACSGKIDSLIELLLGKLSKNIMEVITHPKQGLFPNPNEIKLSCSCPDWAELCKHIAAVLYGIGARFDKHPEDLFLLRGANHLELISKASKAPLITPSKDQETGVLNDTDLSTLFGVNIDGDSKTTVRSKKILISRYRSSKSKTNRKKSASVTGKKPTKPQSIKQVKKK